MIRPHDTITPLPDTKPDAVPELWNSRYRETDDNFKDLDTHLLSALGSIASQGERITDIENQSAGSVSQALRLDWLYSSKKKIALELFYDSWTLLPGLTSTVVDAVAGDDSLDLDTTAGLEPGTEYVIFDGTHQETVAITEILTQTRVRCADSLVHSFTNAPIRRTSWTVSDGKAAAGNGGIYMAPNLNLGNENQDRALVVRRHDNDTELSVYFRDSAHIEWTEAAWSWRRSIDDGVVDVEYRLPSRGIFDIRITSTTGPSGQVPDIHHIAFVDEATGLGGLHHPPGTPAVIYPADGAVDIGEQPSLTTNVYVHDGGTALRGSEFQISTSGDFSSGSLVDASGLVPGISYSPGKGVLSTSTLYYVRARHTDVNGGNSEWSDVISFTTAASFVTVNKPLGLTPAPGSELGYPTGLTFVSSPFGTEGGSDTHAASQWQMASDPAFGNILHDSGTTAADLVSHNLPDGIVAQGSTYYWRVRHEGTAEGWSDWSDAAMFSVAAFVPFVSVLEGSGEDIFSAVTIDASGHIYAAGHKDLSPLRNPLLAKFKTDGTLVWQKALEGSGDDRFWGVCTDLSGNIYAAGFENSSTDGNYFDALLTRFSPDGILVWQKHLGGSHNHDDNFRAMVTDDSGNVYVAGYERGPIVKNNALLVKFEPNGSLSWKTRLGGGGYDLFSAVAIDSYGYIYTAGCENSSTGSGYYNALLTKYRPDGGLEWQKKLGGSSDDEFRAIEIDGSDNIYAAGFINNPSGRNDGLLAKFTSEGSLIWQRKLAGEGDCRFWGVTVDRDYNAYPVGYESNIAGNYEAFLTRFSPDGSLEWQKKLGGSNNDECRAVATDVAGNVYAVGYERSTTDGHGALLASIRPDGSGASGTIPGITTLTWSDSDLSVTDPVLAYDDPSLTSDNPNFTEDDPGLIPGDPNLTQNLSDY
ncbi:MAG: hypothetical protein V6Z89_14650 [Desulfobacter sp.]